MTRLGGLAALSLRLVAPVSVFVGSVVILSIGLGLTTTPRIIATQAMLPFVGIGVMVAALVAVIRRQRVTAAVGCVVVLASAALVVPTMTPSDAPAWSARAARLTMYSANLFRDNPSPDRAFAAARAADADVVLFNEYRSSFEPALRRSGLLDRYRTVVRDDHVDHNLLLTRLPVTSTEVLSRKGFEMPSARVLVGPDDREVLIAGVHTQAPASLAYVDRWAGQIEGVVQALDAVDDVENVVAIGDFNSSIWNPPFRRVFEWGFVDAHATTGSGLARTWGTTSSPFPLLGIDHAISRGPAIVPLSITEGDVPGSDHRSILVTYAVA